MSHRRTEKLPGCESRPYREHRKRELKSLSSLRLAGLILDYDIFLQEDSDAVEVILNHEFGPEIPLNNTPQVPVHLTTQLEQAEYAGPIRS